METLMKVAPRILPFFLAVIIVAAPFYGQKQPTGTVTGMVVDKDGKTPLVGAVVQIDSLARTTEGRIVLLERITTKTLRDGRYSCSGVIAGRIRVTIIVNNQPAMSYGGDDIVVLEGRETVADFDLSKAPAN